ncbi:MAG: hypothetical protein V1816_12575 [Pseudomonadota bacterium]
MQIGGFNTGAATTGAAQYPALQGYLERVTGGGLREFQQEQVETKIAIQKAVLNVAGYGHLVDTVV